MKQVRAGVEMAILDALAHSVGMPLWWLFGGQGNSVVTDITVRVSIDASCSSASSIISTVDHSRSFDGKDFRTEKRLLCRYVHQWGTLSKTPLEKASFLAQIDLRSTAVDEKIGGQDACTLIQMSYLTCMAAPRVHGYDVTAL